MAKGAEATPVDRDILTAAVTEAEQTETFPGLSVLYKKVAEIYNSKGPETPISLAIAMARIQKWKIPTKTKKGRRGNPVNGISKPTPKQPEPEPEPEPIVVEPPKIISKFDKPTRTDVENSDSFKLCGCRNINIIAPAGNCPVKLTATDIETLRTWVTKVVEAGHAKGLHFGPSALRCFSRQFYDYNDSDYKIVLENLGVICEEQRSGATWAISNIQANHNTDIDTQPAEEDDALDLDFDFAPSFDPVDLSDVEDEILEGV